jgi:cytochrome c-type biogenesis protein CcmF
MIICNFNLMGIIFFFLTLILFANNPFMPSISVPADGKGLNPLLQNIAMVVHPPALYLGFTGFSVPFAFVIAALGPEAGWSDRATRRWVLVSGCSGPSHLGGAWAYVGSVGGGSLGPC